MQQFRKIRSLQEDLESLGLTKKTESRYSEIQDEREQPPVVEENDEFDVEDILEGIDLEDLEEGEDTSSEDTQTESEESDDDNLTEGIEEGLRIQRTKRMSPGDRAKSRIDYRKNKAKIKRQRKMRAKTSAFKLRKKRTSSLKKGRSAGPRRRFVLKQSMGESQAILESLENLEITCNIHEELEKAFDNVNELAATLSRKFAVVEEKMLQMEMAMEPEIEHPESEYDYENDEDNIKPGGKTGDATDKAKDAPKGNVKAESDDLEESVTQNPDWGFHGTVMSGYGLNKSDAAKLFKHIHKKMMQKYKEDSEVIREFLDGRPGRHMADAMSYHLDIEDPEEPNVSLKDAMKAAEKAYQVSWIKKEIAAIKKEMSEDIDDLEETIDMMDEMVNLRLEAQDAMDKLKSHVISPKEAGDILRDMVQYMGGAMKMYMDLAQGISKYAYAGVGAPRPDATMLPQHKRDNNYIGKDGLDTEPGSPQQYKERT